MANNRVYIACRYCEDEGEQDLFHLGKYYPSTGWYPKHGNLEDWMERHSHEASDDGYDDQGRPPFFLFFEVGDISEDGKLTDQLKIKS
jgi:hypothetical protein